MEEREYTDQDLRKLQLVMLEMLKVFNNFCIKHKLKYSLYGGTLIGAVRHHGFIPWDDDLDVCMEREDYEHFIQLWKSESIKGFFLQNKETDENFTQTFTKIRKNGTTFLQFESERGKMHTGIFIDIFPHDRIPQQYLFRKIYQFYAVIYQLFTREFVPPKSNLCIKFLSKILLMFTSHKFRMNFRKILEKKLKKYNKDKNLEVASTSCLFGIIHPYPSSFWRGQCVAMKFEDEEFLCAPGWHEALRHEFGDYMKLPPEESRQWKHHPIVLDTDNEITM